MCCNPFKPFIWVIAIIFWGYVVCELAFGMYQIEGCGTVLRFVNHSFECCKLSDSVKCHVIIGKSVLIDRMFSYVHKPTTWW